MIELDYSFYYTESILEHVFKNSMAKRTAGQYYKTLKKFESRF